MDSEDFANEFEGTQMLEFYTMLPPSANQVNNTTSISNQQAMLSHTNQLLANVDEYSYKRQKPKTSGDRIQIFLEEQLGRCSRSHYNKYKYNGKEGSDPCFTREINVVSIDQAKFFSTTWNEWPDISRATVLWSLRMIYLDEDQRKEFDEYFQIEENEKKEFDQYLNGHDSNKKPVWIKVCKEIDSDKFQNMMTSKKIELRRIFNKKHYNEPPAKRPNKGSNNKGTFEVNGTNWLPQTTNQILEIGSMQNLINTHYLSSTPLPYTPSNNLSNVHLQLQASGINDSTINHEQSDEFDENQNNLNNPTVNSEMQDYYQMTSMDSTNSCAASIVMQDYQTEGAVNSDYNIDWSTTDKSPKDEAKNLFFGISKLNEEQLRHNIFPFDSFARKVVAYCDGNIVAVSLIADYISKVEDTQEKMERLPFIIDCLENGKMELIEGFLFDGVKTNLKDYLIYCLPEKNDVCDKVKRLALFPGGCCIPLIALNWIWSTNTKGETRHYIDILVKKSLLTENNGLYSLPYLFYLLLRNLCDQDWLPKMEREQYVALRDYSFGSYTWLKKIIETLGIDIFKQQHLKFLEKNTDSSEIQTYLAHTYILMFSEPRTVDAVKKNLDKVVQYVERQLDELLREIQTILQSLAAPCGVLLCLSSLQRTVDFILKEHEADNYHQGVSRFTANYLEHIEREVLRFSGAYEFFKCLHQEWSQYDGAAESLESHEPKSSKEEVTSRTSFIDSSRELTRQNNNNLSETANVTSDEELVTQAALSEHFFASHERSNAEKHLGGEDMDYN